MRKLIVAGTETVIPPLLRLGNKISVFPLWKDAWARRHEQVPIVQAQVKGLKVSPGLLLPWVAEQVEDGKLIEAEVGLQVLPALTVLIDLLNHIDQSSELEISGVVVQNDVEPMTRAACLWGNQKGIATIHVPHAHYFDIWRDGAGWDIHDEVTARTVLAINERQAEWYRARGVEDVVVTGNPVWDRWSRPRIGQEKAQSLLGLDSRPVITYMTTWPQSTSLLGAPTSLLWDAFGALCLALQELDWQLVLLHHFRSSEDIRKRHLEIARRIGVKGISTVENFELCLQAGDIVTAFGPSNTLIEAAILGKPVLAIGGTVEPVLGVRADPHDILKALLYLRGKKPSEEVLELAPYVGEATGRAAREIEQRCL